MKTQPQLLITCITVAALSLPFAAHGASKKAPSPTPSAAPSVAAKPSATPKTKATPAPKTSPSASPAGKTTTDPDKARAIPFHGMISAVDNRAKTFTIAGKEHSRVFKITDKTVMTKAGAAATIKDVVANEEARGSYWKVTDGSLEAKTVKLGPKTDAEKAADEKAKARKKEKESAAESSASPSASPKP
ncbi:MAG: hypothetical protein ACJ8M4_07350 [Chthoniobacterales bacterium]